MLKYLKKYWLFGILAPLFMIGEVCMDLLQPTLMSTIVDEGVLGLSNNNIGDLGIVLRVGIQMICAVVLGGICGILSCVFANLCGQRFGNDIRKDCFRKVMSFSFEQTDKFSTGSLITRVTNDVTQLQNFVMQCIRNFVRTGMILFGSIFCISVLNIKFSVIIACVVPVVIIFILFFLFRANPIFSKLQDKLDNVNNVMQENVTGSRVVKAYVREEYEKERFGNANDELVNTQLSVLVLFSFMTPIMNIVLNMITVLIIKIGAIEVQAGVLTPGNIMAAVTYVTQILHGVMMLIMIFQTISRGMASAGRIKEVLECEPAIVGGIYEEDNPVRGRIEFKNVSFAYPNGNGENVLSNINLTINSGETVGILGATGSGKSSLVNLIPRFYDVTEGSVLLDGVDVREYQLKDLRDRIAIALQKSELFSMSIKENIMWGNADASDEEVSEAAVTAQAASFINETESGYDTAVAEKGMSLSGGQKQRIAISRAVLKEAEVLIFDDSTSALDLKTEAALYNSLRNKCSETTKIIIAQRIASVKNADRIIVLDNGNVVAFDNHDELMKSCDIYRDIYSSQLGGGGDTNE